MALIPNSNLVGLPEITVTDLKSSDPARLNRVLRLLASQIKSVQTGISSSSTITNITNVNGGGSSGGGGGGSSSSVITTQGTHAQRLSTSLAPSLPAGSYYYETDRTVTYLNFLTPANVQVWQWVSGTMLAIIASRPTDLGMYDAGFVFYATDLALTYLWSGSAWEIVNNIEPVLQDTHANRLADYPSVTFSPSTLFWETDRTVFYIVENAVGTVDISGGTSVAWASGNKFINTGSGFNAAQWPAGTIIKLAGVPSTIVSVSSGTALTIVDSLPDASGVDYVVTSGRWVYSTGILSAVQADIPSDLGENDSGFLDSVTDYAHLLQWSVSAFMWGPGESGSGYFQDFAVAPTGAGWQACDGSTNVAYLKKDGTTATLSAVPNTNSSAAYRKLGASYDNSITAAVAPTVTPTGNVSSVGSFSGDTQTGVNVLSTGGVTSVIAAPYTPSGGVSVASVFTGIPDTTSLAGGDPVDQFQAIQYFRI